MAIANGGYRAASRAVAAQGRREAGFRVLIDLWLR